MPIPRTDFEMEPHADEPQGTDSCPLSRQWTYAIVLDLGGHRQLIQRHGFNDDDLAAELGLEALIEDEFDPRQALALLRRERRRFMNTHANFGYPDRMEENLQALANLVGLNEAERHVLGFCVLMNTDPILDSAVDLLGLLGFNRSLRVLSALLEIPRQELSQCLSKDGRLVRAGLLEARAQSCETLSLSGRLSIENADLLTQIRLHDGRPIDLFKHAFRRSEPAHLRGPDFKHLDKTLDIATAYLGLALAEGRRGVNILIYGPPGTGKTQLSRLLAQELQASLYEIACADSDGDPISANQRLCAMRSATSVLHAQRAALLLDEIEDIFDLPPLTFSGKHKSWKGWINRMLEENSLPCFWLSNSIEALDNAYIRRFDLVIELLNPPKEQRKRIVQKASGDRLGVELVEKLTSHDHVTPAMLTRAVRVARTLHPRASRALDSTVQGLVDATLKAQGYDQLERNQAVQLPSFYSPGLINTDIPLDNLIRGLHQHQEARLCFYGPPGTGKTAFGHWLGQELQKPLMVQRVSDLVSPYVGSTEQNLAQAFTRASEENAILLLDEVDSFLQDRRKAKQSWEVTAVNEMLTQMESFKGLFIASTNLIRDLDEASLRRFDLKVHFSYLTANQVQALFSAHLRALKLKDPGRTAGQRLHGATDLTPGDFALIARQARFRPFATANEVATALLAECRLKRASLAQPIGFVH